MISGQGNDWLLRVRRRELTYFGKICDTSQLDAPVPNIT